MKRKKEVREKSQFITAIIVAAGAGKRLKSKTPKGFVKLGGKNLFLYSLETFLKHPKVRNAVVVVPAGMIPTAEKLAGKILSRKPVTVIAGGTERWESVANGVTATEAEFVLIHDAARPFVTKTVIDQVLNRSPVFDCAITVTPVTDTIRTRSGEIAGEIVDRDTLVRVGTPQLFRRSVLIEALKIAPTLPTPPTDEAALVQLLGVPVALAWGDPMNFKITTPEDLTIAEAIVAKSK